jgi:hypothetical protein
MTREIQRRQREAALAILLTAMRLWESKAMLERSRRSLAVASDARRGRACGDSQHTVMTAATASE